MATRHRPLTDSPFDTLERTFALLVTGPDPLALDAAGVEGLPDRPIPLGELKSRLLHPSTRFETRDAIVAELVARAQREGGKWTVGLAGVLLPGLRRTVRPLVVACPGKADDIEAEALAAFVAAVSRCRPGRPRLASWLRWQARKGATRLLHAEMAERARPGTEPVSAAPPRPWGHPDLVIAKAVQAGVISDSEAELISATRIGDTDLADAAARLGLGYWACHKRRLRAEAALVEWVTGDSYSDIALDATNRAPRSRQSIPEQGRRGRPRHGRSVAQRRV